MSSSVPLQERYQPRQRPLGPPGVPRLLAGIEPHRHLSLEEHTALHTRPTLGIRGSRRRRRERASLLLDEIERSGLLGHGGAAFPVAAKMRAVTAQRGRAVVVANGTEGEPASEKDRVLLERLPHLVLDGGLISAAILDADELVIAACETSTLAFESVRLAIAERERSPLFERQAKISVSIVPSGYISGQETALVSHINGGPALPSFAPPRPFERGVKRRPTLINNAETLAHLALIARHGAEWFRDVGVDGQPGSTLITLSGAVRYPGVYEVEHGAPLRSLVGAAGGASAPARAALIGGYAGTWIDGRALDALALSNDDLIGHSASLGAGVVFILSDDACPVAETARLARWLADEGAGQCGPCLNGLDALAGTIAEIAGGIAEARVTDRIERLARLTSGRGACGHPDGAVRQITSAARTFAAEFSDHAEHGPCDACSRAPELEMPLREAQL